MTRTSHAAAAKKPQQADQVGQNNLVDGAIQGGTMVLTLVKQASSLAPLPYLSEAAGLALNLIAIAQAVRDNRAGFQELADDSTQLVAVFWRSYQGAKNQQEWLNNEGIRTSARILQRSLKSIIELGERMNSRNIILRIFFYIFDANTIKSYRQKLNTAVTQFQVAAQLDAREILAQIEKNQDELLVEVRNLKTSPPAVGPSSQDVTTSHRAIENENRARQRIRIRDVENSGIAMGPGSVDVENHGVGENNRQGSSPPQAPKTKSDNPSSEPRSGKGKGKQRHVDDRLRPSGIDINGVYNSGIAMDGDVSVKNY